MPSARRRGLVTNRSSPTSWIFAAQLVGQQLPALPVIFGTAVFDRDDRVIRRQPGQELDVLLDGQGFAFALHLVLAALEVFRGRAIQRQVDILARLVARLFDGFQNEIQARRGQSSGSVQSRPRRRSRCCGPPFCSSFFSVWNTSDPIRTASRMFCGAHRHDHEFLNVDRVVGMFAAVDDVHHRHRQHPGRGAADIAVQAAGR